jgi:hypothetical protein
MGLSGISGEGDFPSCVATIYMGEGIYHEVFGTRDSNQPHILIEVYVPGAFKEPEILRSTVYPTKQDALDVWVTRFHTNPIPALTPEQ